MNYNGRGYASAAPRQPYARPQAPTEPSGDARVLPALATLILAVVVNFMVLAKVDPPVVRPVLGFWFVLIFPAYLLYTSSAWRRCGLAERVGYSVCAVLLSLMLSGLAINEVLPLGGIQRPLEPGPIVVVSDVINLALYIYRSRNRDDITLRVNFAEFSREEFRLLVAAVLAVVLAVFGANRLNNGASGNVTWVALALVALIGVCSVRWLKYTRETLMAVVIYFVSLSLLLTTSLRGWYVTGHDIQQEYLVFQLTETHGHWSMAYFQDAYNACLSITILPTELGQIIGVDSPYVYKLFFELIFALSPVLAYAVARRFFNRGISTLAVAYFVGFPTFFTDMPFLNRQEIALLFVSVGLLAATNPKWSFRRRQVSLAVAGLGTELSHYSTMYVFVGTLVIALICSYIGRLFIKTGPEETQPQPTSNLNPARHYVPRRITTLKGAVSISLFVVFIGIIFAWGTLATKTTDAVLADGKDALTSGSISISGFGSGGISDAEIQADYRQDAVDARAGVPAGTYLPLSAASKAPAPIYDGSLRPLTAVGTKLNSVGVPVATLNSLARSLVAYGEELFLGVGLVRLLLVGRRQGRLIGGQFFWLAFGSTAMIVLITVVPSIAADYGVLRAFQQGLVFFSPIIVIGSMTVFAPIGKQRARIAACAVCLGVFLATSTLIPQLLGDNLAELNLNNNGSYYDMYYTTPQEADALAWLGAQPKVLNYPIQGSWDVRKWEPTDPRSITGERVIDEYPTLVYQSGWVILGNLVTRADMSLSLEPISNAIVEYKYPVGLLQDYKNLVYTDGGAIIYK
jgi:uncharacterized membrane protein